jgi:2-polyprenyl-3-methyl-5-hydroxy-6-metoxy-1,4-benzoquinol methylase
MVDQIKNMDAHPQEVYARILKTYVRPGLRWLDIGCGRQIVPDWAWRLNEQKAALKDVELSGLDTDSAIHEHPFLSRRLIGLADSIDAPDSYFDLITANMVMEHVPDPLVIYREVFRVLQPGGTFLIHTPNKWYYLLFLAKFAPEWLKHRVIWLLERRHSADVFPTFYRSNTESAFYRWAAQSGFTVKSIVNAPPPPSFQNIPIVRNVERAVLLPLFKQPWANNLRATFIVQLVRPAVTRDGEKHHARNSDNAPSGWKGVSRT